MGVAYIIYPYILNKCETIISGNCKYLPVMPGSFVISVGVFRYYDDGNGNLLSSTTNTVVGNINYTSGKISGFKHGIAYYDQILRIFDIKLSDNYFDYEEGEE